MNNCHATDNGFSEKTSNIRLLDIAGNTHEERLINLWIKNLMQRRSNSNDFFPKLDSNITLHLVDDINPKIGQTKLSTRIWNQDQLTGVFSMTILM